LISVVFAYEFHLKEDGTRGVASSEYLEHHRIPSNKDLNNIILE